MKEKSFKRWLSLALAVLMIITAVPLAGGTFEAKAEDGKFTEGYYTYTVENGEATITGCDRSISGDVVIPDTLGGYPVTNIGREAFFGCTRLTSVIIPNGVTNVGIGAFECCKSMTSVTIPNSVTKVQSNAFADCTGLTKINWNAEIEAPSPYDDIFNIFSNAGTEGDGIDVVFGDNVSRIPDYVFCSNNEPNIKSVTIGNSVEIIGECAFQGCTGLTSITIPNSVIWIRYCAFADCTGLTKINWNAENVDDFVHFSGDMYSVFIDSGTEGDGIDVVFGDNVKSIPANAFYNVSNIKSITIGNNVESIGNSAFDGTAWYNAQSFGDVYAGKVYYKYKGTMPENTSVIIKDGTRGITGGALSGCTGLVDITIPNSVTNIGNGAFYDCTGLTKINWNAENVSNSGYGVNVFSNAGTAGNGIDVVFGNSVKNIPPCLFDVIDTVNHDYVNPKIKSVTIGNSVTSIGGCAFKGCTGLTSIIIPNSVTNIIDSAFENCTGLTSVTIGNNIENIGNYAFYNCTSLTSIIIPNSVTNIIDSAFENCTGLTSVTIGNNIENIGNYAFYNCTSLTSVTIGKNVTNIGWGALGYYYSEYTNLDEIPNFTIYGYAGTAAETYANENGFTFIPLEEEKNEVKDETTGVSISYPNDVYDNDIQLNVSVVTDGSAFNVLNTEKGNFKKSLFDIATTINGEKVQPNGTVFVKIPLPNGYSAEKTVVYYITNDGELEKMESKIENGCIIFETTHFSFYAIVDETSTTNPSQNCSCNCHKSGISKFFFKIVLIFQKLFKKNRVCLCGVNHY